jgi:hypothetical protein
MPAVATVIELEPPALGARSRRAVCESATHPVSPYCRQPHRGSQTGPRTLVDATSLKACGASLPIRTDDTPIPFNCRAHALPRSRTQRQH